MLLFIDAVHVTMLPRSRFNTSHVTLYPLYADGNDAVLESFNTSHVTLYHSGPQPDRSCAEFQYISCYSLSATPLQAHEPQERFNTSHVTLYHHTEENSTYRQQVSIHLMLLFILVTEIVNKLSEAFQYISCYSLSTTAWKKA